MSNFNKKYQHIERIKVCTSKLITCTGNEAEKNAVFELTVDKMLGMVDTARCTDYTQLLALVHTLR